jgi:hypothetical protein
MKIIKHKELAILLVGSIACAGPLFAAGADDATGSVSSSGTTSCSSGSSGSSGKCKRAYTVNGVVSSAGTGLDTAFTCTNMEQSKNVIIEIAIFASNGTPLNTNTANNGVTEIEPGHTATLTTGDVAAINGETIIQLANPANPPGAASIGSTSSKIICSAYLLDDTDSPPASLMQLTMIKGTSQKGN